MIDTMSMVELDPPGFQPPRPVAGEEGSRRTVRYGGYTVFSVFQPVFSVSHRRAIGYHASLRAHDEDERHVPSHEVFTQAARIIEAEHPDIRTQSEESISITQALETINSWLERVAMRDPALFEKLIRRIKLNNISKPPAALKKKEAEPSNA